MKNSAQKHMLDIGVSVLLNGARDKKKIVISIEDAIEQD